MKMIRSVSSKYILAMFLAICFVVLSAAPESSAHRRSYRHHHSKTKGALIGGAVGAVGGALIGGKKGAVIGGAAGAGTGAVVQHRRNTRQRRYHRRHR
ncbi:MAG: YMGG-like glycine zipper-containing protein [Acidobacteriota bacterium]